MSRKRIIQSKAKKVFCKECEEQGIQNEISLYALSSHIKFNHEIGVDGYVQKHGEFRKIRTKKGNRNIKKVECMICNQIYSIVGIATHFLDAHNITVQQYVEKYGEYRPKYLNYQKRAEESGEYKCKVHGCKFNGASETHLSFHIRIDHNKTKEDYILNDIFNGHMPLCKCGCGEEVPIHSHKQPYHGLFVNGHSSRGENNGRFGVAVEQHTREAMSEKALLRIENNKKNGIDPWHDPEAIKKRAAAYYNNISERYRKECFAECLTPYNFGQRSYIFEYKCLKCGEIWQQFSRHPMCLKCNPPEKSTSGSKEQDQVIEYLKSLEIKLDINNRRIIKPFELDIVIEDKKVCIEYDGLRYHHERGRIDRMYHLNKTEYAKSVGYSLIHIFCDEWKTKNEIVKSKLRHILGLNVNCEKIYGRKCIIKEIPSTLKNNFLEQFHIMGKDRSKINLGAYYDGKLIAVMTFRTPEKGAGHKVTDTKNTFELSRYCTDYNYIAVGLAGKLLSYMIAHYTPDKIISFADRRWTLSEENLYSKLGFELIGETPPSYWYTNNFLKRYNRRNFQKKKLIKIDEKFKDMTEHEIMKQLGYHRVWDCGSYRYELDLSNKIME